MKKLEKILFATTFFLFFLAIVNIILIIISHIDLSFFAYPALVYGLFLFMPILPLSMGLTLCLFLRKENIRNHNNVTHKYIKNISLVTTITSLSLSLLFVISLASPAVSHVSIFPGASIGDGGRCPSPMNDRYAKDCVRVPF